jgi:heat shock protein HslJ
MNRITTLGLAACLACGGTEPGEVALPSTQWVLAELDGESITPVGERGTGYLRFERSSDRFAASVGCNSMGGRWTSDDDALAFSQIVSTLMACEEPLMTRERQLSEALTTTTSFRTRDGRLELLRGNKVLAAFTAGSGG